MTNKSYFQTRFTFDAKRDLVWKYICNYIQRYIPLNSRVLDIGTGYCNFINNIKALDKHALDNSELAAQSAGKDVTFHLGSVTEMRDLPSSYFDIIFASNLLEHLSEEELELVFSQIKRLLRNKGKVIILQPNFKYCYKVYFDDHTHKQIFTDKGIVDLLVENGFRPAKIYPRFLPFSMKSKFPKFGFLIWLYLRSPVKPFAGQMLIIAKKE